jgi:hypothetical protein
MVETFPADRQRRVVRIPGNDGYLELLGGTQSSR